MPCDVPSRSRPTGLKSSSGTSFSSPHTHLCVSPRLPAMTNWKDPAIVAQDFCAHFLSSQFTPLYRRARKAVYLKLAHVLMGIVLWEFAVTCHYELAVLFRRRPYQWTIWIYVWCRITAVVFFLCVTITKDFTGVMNCRAWDIAIYTFSYTSLGLALFIIVLRIIAIWERRVWICGFSIALWLGSIALNIYHITIVRTTYEPLSGVCIPLGTDDNLANCVGILISDFGLLILMIAGILRQHPYGAIKLLGPHSLWGILWHQSLMWLALASVAEIPAVVLLFLNSNDAINVMLPLTVVAVLSVGATRMYRGLANYPSFMEFHPKNTSIRTPIGEAVRVCRTQAVHRNDGTVMVDPGSEMGLGRIHVDFDGVLDTGRDKGTQNSNEYAIGVLGSVKDSF
ncbi:hypothetical protein FA95DRAFT_336419 [Auriscalpium vulgare]|uniref:Uncharacterized protein n=1 Tax=Auriscalpium vulgare TaxID=40419 RepID=A0ACB8RHZ0_9AGAM|nr:hypothetical protein FA95DRAFT_336419 [Auriscalpium vulgare]